MNPKGQTALEYLLIAVVALVVVAVVYNYAQTTSETTQEQGSGIATEVFERMNEDIAGSTCSSSGAGIYEIVDYGSVVDYSSEYQYLPNYAPEKAIDSFTETYWASYYENSEREENIKINLGSSVCVDALRAQIYAAASMDVTLKLNGVIVAKKSVSLGWQYISVGFTESRNINEIEVIADIPSGIPTYFLVSNFDIMP